MPFGRPVEPDVKMRYCVSSPVTQLARSGTTKGLPARQGIGHVLGNHHERLPELGQDVRETRKGHLRVYGDERMPAFKAAEKPCDHTCGFVAEHHRRLSLLRAGRQGGGNAIGGLP